MMKSAEPDDNTKQPKVISPNRRVYKLVDIIEIFAMSRSAIYRAMENDGFPKAMKLSGRSVGWERRSVDEWFENRPTAVAPCADADQYQSATYLRSRPGVRDAA